jgi:hypothetical protein
LKAVGNEGIDWAARRFVTWKGCFCAMPTVNENGDCN